MSKATAPSIIAEAAAAYKTALENFHAGKARSKAINDRPKEIAAKIQALRVEHAAALRHGDACAAQFIDGNLSAEQWTAADAAIDDVAQRIGELEAMHAKLTSNPHFHRQADLTTLLERRDDAREWLSLVLVQDYISDATERMASAMPAAFAAWMITRQDALQYGGLHSEYEKLWAVFWSTLTPPCPPQSALDAAFADVQKRVPALQ